MKAANSLGFNPGPSASVVALPTAEPKIFARSILVPPGLPWEQGRAARLDAQHGSPLPFADVVHQLRRTEPWRWGEPGRFAAFYLRRTQARSRYRAKVQLLDETFDIVFLPPADRQRQAQAVFLAIFSVLCAGVIASAAIFQALDARAKAEVQLLALERASMEAMSRARVRADQNRLATSMDAHERGVRPDIVLADFLWAAQAKSGDARINAWHWQPGLMAVEARGKVNPFLSSDRLVQRAKAPVSKGVWLWGIAPREYGKPLEAKR
jgi:hypothetical protein